MVPPETPESIGILRTIPYNFHNNSYYGVGISDCIENSEELALKLIKLLKEK